MQPVQLSLLPDQVPAPPPDLIGQLPGPQVEAAITLLAGLIAKAGRGRRGRRAMSESAKITASHLLQGGHDSFGVGGERAGQDGCGVWPTSLTHCNPESGARSACLGPAGVSRRGGPAVDLIHEFPVHLPGGVEVVRQLTGVGLELADLLA